jgi:hypothetical protein
MLWATCDSDAAPDQGVVDAIVLADGEVAGKRSAGEAAVGRASCLIADDVSGRMLMTRAGAEVSLACRRAPAPPCAGTRVRVMV